MVDDLLFVVMRGGVTRAEQTMLDFGQQDLVRNFRQQFENEMTKRLVDAVEDLTGRQVLTYQSQDLFDPHVVDEIFVVEAPATDPELREAAGRRASDRSLGEVREDRQEGGGTAYSAPVRTSAGGRPGQLERDPSGRTVDHQPARELLHDDEAADTRR